MIPTERGLYMFEQIKEILLDELAIDENLITPDAALHDSLGVSSLEFLNVIMAIEDAFSISMDSEHLATLKTVGDVVSYIESLAEGK